MALHILPKWFNPMVVTALQIAQMLVGVVVTLAGFYFFQTDTTCDIEPENNTAAFVMYGSYLVLFVQFFAARYQPTVTMLDKKKKKTTTNENGMRKPKTL
jgi:elongation of very long chain fatty acids protein 6